MYSSEAISGMLSIALSAEYAKTRAASNNIASASSPTALYHHVDFLSLITEVDNAFQTNDHAAFKNAVSSDVEIDSRPGEDISIDHEVALMLSAETRFRVLAEIYQRHSGLKQLAYSTRR